MQKFQIITLTVGFATAALVLAIYFSFRGGEVQNSPANAPIELNETPPENDNTVAEIVSVPEQIETEEIVPVAEPPEIAESSTESIPEDEEIFFLTPEKIGELIDEKGALKAYEEGSDNVRREIIAYLADRLEIEPYLVDFVRMEDNSDIRADLFINYYPSDMFEFSDGALDEETGDSTLEEALDQPVESNIEPLEYASRIKAAMALDAELAIEQSRLARDSWPEDEYLQYISAQTMLRANQTTDTLKPEELSAAYENVREVLDQAPWESDVTPSERIEGFYAMMDWGSDGQRRQFFEQQIALETDKRALDILVRLLETIPAE